MAQQQHSTLMIILSYQFSKYILAPPPLWKPMIFHSPTEKVYSGEASYPCLPTEQPELLWDKFDPGVRLIDGYGFRNDIDLLRVFPGWYPLNKNQKVVLSHWTHLVQRRRHVPKIWHAQFKISYPCQSFKYLLCDLLFMITGLQ